MPYLHTAAQKMQFYFNQNILRIINGTQCKILETLFKFSFNFQSRGFKARRAQVNFIKLRNLYYLTIYSIKNNKSV